MNYNHSGKCKFITPRNDLVTENTEKIVTKGMKSLHRVPIKKKLKKKGVHYRKYNFVTENTILLQKIQIHTPIYENITSEMKPSYLL